MTSRPRPVVVTLALCGAFVLASAPHPAAGQAAPARTSATAADGQALLATITQLAAPGMEGRAVGTEGNRKARALIEQRLTAAGLAPAGASGFATPFSFTDKAGATIAGVNLLARCAGRDATAASIVVSAHYDHLGIRDGAIYHGADDNASGVALALWLAERCVKAPFTHTVLFAFFDAEERGLQGAHAFVRAPAVPLDRIALNVNFDMVSRSDRREIYVAGPGRWPALAPLLAKALTGMPITVKFGHDTGGGQDDWTTQSDHGAFHGAGVPFVYFGVEDHADYHKPTDTADKIAPDFLSGVATTVVTALMALDGAATFK